MGENSLDKLKPIDKEIDGSFYTFYYLKPRISFAILSKILRIIGPAMSAAFENVPEEDIGKIKAGDIDVDLGEIDFGKSVKMLLDNFHTVEVQQIIDTVLDQAMHKGLGNVLQNYDNLFTGKLKHLFKVVYAALEVQYADFFAGKNVAGRMLNMISQANPIQNITTPESLT